MTSIDSKNSYSFGRISEKDFRRVSALIYERCGIRITDVKKPMVESRLSKRLRALGMDSFKTYCTYLFEGGTKDDELTQLIDVMTTNKTDFFREPAHFGFLVERAIPDLIETHETGPGFMIHVWSAGCSSGEEPYTLAMVLNETAEQCGMFTFSVLATDISTRMLEAAKKAIYHNDRISPVPAALKKKYLLRGKNGREDYVRIVPEIRSLVEFRRLNFMDADFGFRARMHIIFCRNVIIYFDRPTQERLLKRFCSYLMPGGFLFMGHAETLNGMALPLAPVAPTVYRRLS